jgi:hypothetical protein
VSVISQNGLGPRWESYDIEHAKASARRLLTSLDLTPEIVRAVIERVLGRHNADVDWKVTRALSRKYGRGRERVGGRWRVRS